MIDRKRLAHLLPMMGSNQDGEALNAARLAERLRKEAGVSWEQLLEERVVEKIIHASQDELTAAYWRGYEKAEQLIRPPKPPSGLDKAKQVADIIALDRWIAPVVLFVVIFGAIYLAALHQDGMFPCPTQATPSCASISSR